MPHGDGNVHARQRFEPSAAVAPVDQDAVPPPAVADRVGRPVSLRTEDSVGLHPRRLCHTRRTESAAVEVEQ